MRPFTAARFGASTPRSAGASSRSAARAPSPNAGRYVLPSGHASPKPSIPEVVVIRTTVLGNWSITRPVDITYSPWAYVRS